MFLDIIKTRTRQLWDKKTTIQQFSSAFDVVTKEKVLL